MVTLIETKKKKKLKKLLMADIQSLDEEGEDKEPLAEGFRLQADSVHCLNISDA